MVTLQDIFPKITPRENNSGNHSREGRVHHGGKEHLQRTTTPIRIAPQSIRDPKNNHTRDAEPYIRDGWNGTEKCSTYKQKLYSDGAIITSNYNDECYAGKTQDLICSLKIQQYQRLNITVGFAGEIYLLVENHDLQRNQDTNMMPTTRKDLGAEKGGVNDGYGR